MKNNEEVFHFRGDSSLRECLSIISHLTGLKQSQIIKRYVLEGLESGDDLKDYPDIQRRIQDLARRERIGIFNEVLQLKADLLAKMRWYEKLINELKADGVKGKELTDCLVEATVYFRYICNTKTLKFINSKWENYLKSMFPFYKKRVILTSVGVINSILKLDFDYTQEAIKLREKAIKLVREKRHIPKIRTLEAHLKKSSKANLYK